MDIGSMSLGRKTATKGMAIQFFRYSTSPYLYLIKININSLLLKNLFYWVS
ncbi:hypothetical protein XNC3_2690022 [Xenorhabdus nematophila F1]|nr:hypothetical protein XNC3_2690022 [Xenorhabdus nematophila F1]